MHDRGKDESEFSLVSHHTSIGNGNQTKKLTWRRASQGRGHRCRDSGIRELSTTTYWGDFCGEKQAVIGRELETATSSEPPSDCSGFRALSMAVSFQDALASSCLHFVEVLWVRRSRIGNEFGAVYYLRSSNDTVHTSLSPNGKLRIIVGDNPEGMLVDSETGKMVVFLVGHLDFSSASAWHRDGLTFGTGNQDKTCRIWDARNLSKSVTALKGNLGAIRSIRYSSDSSFMAMAEPADFVHVFDAKSGCEKEQEIDFFGKISGMPFSPDTESLFIGCANVHMVAFLSLADEGITHALILSSEWILVVLAIVSFGVSGFLAFVLACGVLVGILPSCGFGSLVAYVAGRCIDGKGNIVVRHGFVRGRVLKDCSSGGLPDGAVDSDQKQSRRLGNVILSPVEKWPEKAEPVLEEWFGPKIERASGDPPPSPRRSSFILVRGLGCSVGECPDYSPQVHQ
ncbi:hypothetical protein RHGRI_002169 [Rhododendron griersonianum]|uniref:Transducin/WD40 repeat-like superfamily protein n=1 Tax=Rhododendron griersonianum TaxID=479676 RepID=A0AAV6LNT7_9ERIC|nr:hypothetical protein RHGRI_002169 [Rhododendron griersonianum]